jgi:hypothetical protein
MERIQVVLSVPKMQRYANPRAHLRNLAWPDLSQDEALALLEGFRRAHPELTRVFADMVTLAGDPPEAVTPCCGQKHAERLVD